MLFQAWPCRYVYLGMRFAHAGRGIGNAKFDALIDKREQSIL